MRLSPVFACTMCAFLLGSSIVVPVAAAETSPVLSISERTQMRRMERLGQPKDTTANSLRVKRTPQLRVRNVKDPVLKRAAPRAILPSPVRYVPRQTRRQLYRELEKKLEKHTKESETETAEPRRDARTPSTERSLVQLRNEVLDLVNAARQAEGLAALLQNVLLEESAQAYAEDMQRRAFFSHESPEGQKPQDRVAATGYLNVDFSTCDCRSYAAYVGENLARGQQTAQKVFDDWMNSPDHRKNILSDHFKEIGIGIAGEYWAQHFGALEITER